MIEFNTEDYFEVVDEIKNYIDAHNKEVGPFDEKDLDPDYDVYESLAVTDQLAVFTGRDDGKLVAYAIFFLNDHHYYAGMPCAASDLIYVAPEYRGENSMEFIKYCEKCLYRDFAVDGITISMHTKVVFSGMLVYLDYKKSAVVCSKYVGDS